MSSTFLIACRLVIFKIRPQLLSVKLQNSKFKILKDGNTTERMSWAILSIECLLHRPLYDHRTKVWSIINERTVAPPKTSWLSRLIW